ncbi:MAG TPA: peptidylprolyl isomerase [Dehalococcoidia bacterium]|nr:peptidylprolyl isomerase [Dehalococcoidia bacterium]
MFSIRTALILPMGLILLSIVACVVAPSGAPGNSPAPAQEATPIAPTNVTASPTPQSPVSTAAPTVGQTPDGPGLRQFSAPPPLTIDTEKTYTAKLFTNKGEIVLHLFASEAPMTVNNFVFLAREGFYDGVTFHRIIRDFMVQAGDPAGNGTGGPGYQFADEPVTRAYTKGTLAMANSGPNTNGSQFFIVHGADVSLSPNYTIFGEIASGLDTLDAIAATPVGLSPRREPSVPLEPVIIERIEIEESQ